MGRRYRLVKGKLPPEERGPKPISPEKAREMLENPPRGRPLSEKQRRLFGAIASGEPQRGPRP